jgi:phage terminase small subunit
MSSNSKNEFNLNIQQQLFVEDYITTLNGTQSYMKIYGSDSGTARTNAAKLLAKPNVKAYKEYLLAKRREEMVIEREWVIEQAKDTFLKCCKKKPVYEWDAEEKRLKPTGEYQFDSKGAVNALDLIAKVCGYNVVKQEITAEVKESRLDKLADDLFNDE